MSLNYEIESSHVADYQMFSLPEVGFPLRGPYWPTECSTPGLTFLGAAQTFGTFCKYPFPNLLGEMVSARVLNLARGGAGPGFYVDKTRIFDYVNRSDLCVVQVMSARSSMQNKYMHSPLGLASVTMTGGGRKGETVLGHHALQQMADELSRRDFFALVQETLSNYIEQYRQLLSQIEVPTVLVYVAKKPPLRNYGAKDARWTPEKLIGHNPNLVNEATLEAISAFADQTVVVTDERGFDKRLMNRITGECCEIKRAEGNTVRTHSAYLSPYLHTKIALQLYDIVDPMLPKAHREMGMFRKLYERM